MWAALQRPSQNSQTAGGEVGGQTARAAKLFRLWPRTPVTMLPHCWLCGAALQSRLPAKRALSLRNRGSGVQAKKGAALRAERLWRAALHNRELCGVPRTKDPHSYDDQVTVGQPLQSRRPRSGYLRCEIEDSGAFRQGKARRCAPGALWRDSLWRAARLDDEFLLFCIES